MLYGKWRLFCLGLNVSTKTEIHKASEDAYPLPGIQSEVQKADSERNVMI